MGLTKCGLDERTRSEDSSGSRNRRWWKRRRTRGETVVSHVPPHLQVEPLPLDPEQLEIRKAKLEALRDATQEPSNENDEPENT